MKQRQPIAMQNTNSGYTAMPTRFRTTPEPPKMLTPAAKDHATNTRYTGIRAMVGSPSALSMAAMTKGNSV